MSIVDYHKATTKELLAVQDKVRNLVPHWGEDGRYKEVVLKNIIRKFLPSRFSISTGFVVKQTAVRGEHVSSRQIDLIIHDINNPILFREGDFVILTPDSVVAIIEVKTNLRNARLGEVVARANDNGKFIYDGKEDKEFPIFNGIFGYEGYTVRPNMETIIDNISNANSFYRDDVDFEKFKVNHIAFDRNWFLKYWWNEEAPHSIYNIEDLSFSFFISNLIDFVASKSVDRNSFVWFAADKELNLVQSF